jgi:hypothetical protein
MKIPIIRRKKEGKEEMGCAHAISRASSATTAKGLSL